MQKQDSESPWQHISVQNLDGARVPLADLYSQGPAVLVFLRHFG